ncbi:MAG: 4'-phosphopantetheinyl transferase superfamily protein [Polyangiaceae bacterium]|nr:4'-phosphopantetheinyl transferase superfamily protein [Polyangiaceae bacterium]
MALILHLERLLARTCPPDVVFSAADSETRIGPLYEGEETAVVRAVPRRRWEYQAGRHCARQVLVTLGQRPVAIPVGERREPRFPPGIVGSITHSSRPLPAAVAIAADSARYVAIGVDLERRGGAARLDPDLITTEAERAARPPTIPADLFLDLVFSAKEAAYKALSPFVGRILDFGEVKVELPPSGFTYRAFASVSSPELGAVTGRWATDDDFVLCVATIPRHDAAIEVRRPG